MSVAVKKEARVSAAHGKASGARTVEKGKGERIVVRDIVYHGGMCSRRPGEEEVDADRQAPRRIRRLTNSSSSASVASPTE